MRLIKRSIEIFIYGIITNIFRHQTLLTINVLTSISAFIIICTIILYIKSRYAYTILLIGLVIYSFIIPEVISGTNVQQPTDILKTGEYPIAPWLIYSIIGLGIAWFDRLKTKKILLPFSYISILYGIYTVASGQYKLSFIHNTPPFLLIVLGLIGILYILTSTVKSNILSTFGKNSLFIYVSHTFIFSFIPVVISIGKPFGIYTSILIYMTTLGISYYILKEE